MIPDEMRELIQILLDEDKANIVWSNVGTGEPITSQEQFQLDQNKRVQDWLDALPQPPQPDWDAAPEWAQWFAVDAGGDCHWYEREPTTVGSGWMNWHRAQGVNGMDDYHLPIGIDWRTTLAKRPEVTE